MSSDKKKNGKFLTKILIGGALGSVVAWAFGNRKRRETISEEPKKSFFKKIFGRKG